MAQPRHLGSRPTLYSRGRPLLILIELNDVATHRFLRTLAFRLHQISFFPFPSVSTDALLLGEDSILGQNSIHVLLYRSHARSIHLNMFSRKYNYVSLYVLYGSLWLCSVYVI